MGSNNNDQVRSAYQQAVEASRTTCLENAKRVLQLLEIWLNRSPQASLPAMVVKYGDNARSYIAEILKHDSMLTDQAEILETMQGFDRLLSVCRHPMNPQHGIFHSNEAIARPIPMSLAQANMPSETANDPLVSETASAAMPGSVRSSSTTSVPATSTAHHSAPHPRASVLVDTAIDRQRRQSASQNLDGACLFNQSDPNYDPFFLPQERQLLGLPPRSHISPSESEQGHRSV